MRHVTIVSLPLALTLAAITACATDVPEHILATPSSPTEAKVSWGPETPPFNIEVILHDQGGGGGFGLVKFRQPNDGQAIIYLDTWVRDLAPNTSYLLQRAVDTNLDGECTSTAWLTLGKGLTAQSLTTDESGTAREQLWRNVAALPVGSAYDIHFQVVEATTGEVVLTSGCYRYVISL